MIKRNSHLFWLLFFLPYLSGRAIHVFGDSHASFYFSNERTAIPRNERSLFNDFYQGHVHAFEFNIHWFESKTMHRIGRDGLTILNFKNFGINEDDIVVFVFGEIDARCHIGKQRDLKGRLLHEIIDSLVKNFMRTVQKNVKKFKKLHCVVASVIPPTNNAYNWVYPYHGSLEDRVIITQTLNAALQSQCSELGFDFLDIYPLYANAEGALDDRVSDGVVHVNPFENDQIKRQLINLLRIKFVL